jgi:hypothetical protein
MRPFLRRPSPALVVACLALLAALAGTGVASVKVISKPPAVGVIVVKDVFVPAISSAGQIATCRAGQRATGGGAYLEGTPSSDDHIIDSEPAVADKIHGFRPVLSGRATSWHVTYFNPNNEQRRLHVWAICTG